MEHQHRREGGRGGGREVEKPGRMEEGRGGGRKGCKEEGRERRGGRHSMHTQAKTPSLTTGSNHSSSRVVQSEKKK